MSGIQSPMFRIAVWIVALLTIAAATSQFQSRVRAQVGAGNGEPADGAAANEPAALGASPATDDEAVEASNEPPETIGTLVVKSGTFSVAFYVVLFAFSIVALAVALERFVNLRRSKVMPDEFARTLRDTVAGGHASLERLRMLAESSRAPVARILKAAVLKAGRPLPEVEKSMEDAAARELGEMRARSRPLSVVGNIAPLVGLLGTVVGMIFAFSTASQVGLGKAEELAKGIYLALMTTAGGLTIAIPALLAVAWFNSRAERFMREIDECLLETMPSFARLEKPVGHAAPPREELETADAT